jgi:hypothetical protein
MYGDLHFYDDVNQDWSKVSSQSLPSARKYSCMCASYPKLFIFGGITLNGYSNEVWIMDIKNFESELLSVDEPGGPQPTAFAGCKAEVEDGRLVLYVFVGESTGETPLDEVYRFIVKDLQWELLGTLAGRSQTAAMKIGQRVIVAAGEEWGVDANNTVVMKDLSRGGEVSVIGITDRAMYSGASMYHKTSLYIFGGGDKIGEKFRSSVPVHSFYKLDLNSNCGDHCDWPCSLGTYEVSPGVCQICPEGYYSDELGPYCIACPAGTYSTRKGNSSVRQCYPCQEGFYSPSPGALFCKACPAGSYCAIGSSAPFPSHTTSSAITTSQPDLFETGSSKAASASSQLQLVFLVIVCIAVYVVLFSKQRVFKVVKYLDLFDDKHNHKKHVPMTLRKNYCGGAFSLLFYICASFYLSQAFLIYVYDNIEEIKALVPIVTLDKQYDDVRPMQITADIQIKAEFGNYGGACMQEQEVCVALISVVVTGFSKGSFETTCSLSDLGTCTVTLNCQGCQVATGAQVEYQLNEDWSYANFIKTSVTADSSIPGEQSMVQFNISPEAGKVLRGSDSSKIYYELISSVFSSESTEWASEEFGYHVSASKGPEVGSSVSTYEIPGTFGLNLVIYLDLSSTGLLTSRRLKQSTLLLFSSILGSFFGLMRTFGSAMSQAEDKWRRYEQMRSRRGYFKRRVERLKHFMMLLGRSKPLPDISISAKRNKANMTEFVVEEPDYRGTGISLLEDRDVTVVPQ